MTCHDIMLCVSADRCPVMCYPWCHPPPPPLPTPPPHPLPSSSQPLRPSGVRAPLLWLLPTAALRLGPSPHPLPSPPLTPFPPRSLYDLQVCVLALLWRLSRPLPCGWDPPLTPFPPLPSPPSLPSPHPLPSPPLIPFPPRSLSDLQVCVLPSSGFSRPLPWGWDPPLTLFPPLPSPLSLPSPHALPSSPPHPLPSSSQPLRPSGVRARLPLASVPRQEVERSAAARRLDVVRCRPALPRNAPLLHPPLPRPHHRPLLCRLPRSEYPDDDAKGPLVNAVHHRLHKFKHKYSVHFIWFIKTSWLIFVQLCQKM